MHSFPDDVFLPVARGAETTVDLLFAAVAKDDAADVQRLLHIEPALVHSRKEFDGTPLHQARSTEVARLLLRHGAEANAPGWMGATPLHESADRGDNSVVQTLIEAGGEVARASEIGTLPLHRAENADVVRTLLAAYPLGLEARDSHGSTPLRSAAHFGRENAAQALLEAGADVNACDDWGQSALYWAAQEGHVEVVRLLLDHGADINAVDLAFEQTPLHAAAFRGQDAVVEALLEAGAGTSLRNRKGQLAYHCAHDSHHFETAALIMSWTSPEDLGLTEEPQTCPLTGGHSRLRVHPNQSRAVTLAANGRFALWSLDRLPRITHWIQTRSAWLSSVALHPHGELLGIAGNAGGIEIRDWDLRLRRSIPLPKTVAASALTFSPCGRYLAAATVHEELHLISLDSGEVVTTVDAGEWNGTVQFSRDGDLIAIACSFQGGGHVDVYKFNDEGGLVKQWEFSRSNPESAEDEFVDSLASLAFAPDGRTLMLFETSRISSDWKGAWHGNLVALELITGTSRWLAPLDALVTGDLRTLKEAGHSGGFYTELACGNDWTAIGTALGKVLIFNLGEGSLAGKIELASQLPVVSLGWDATSGCLWSLASNDDAGSVFEIDPQGAGITRLR